MSREQIDAFVGEPRIAFLATTRSDGSPTIVPVWIEWDGEHVRLFTDRSSEKIARIHADPRVCVSVAEPVGASEAWVTIEGTATVIDRGAMELAARLARRYYAAEKAEDTIRNWQKLADQWVIVEIRPSRVRSMAPS
jgi:PPOX class probable F420-dependent enzyme